MRGSLCFLYFMNEKFNKYMTDEQLTKMLGRGVRLIIILPLPTYTWMPSFAACRKSDVAVEMGLLYLQHLFENLQQMEKYQVWTKFLQLDIGDSILQKYLQSYKMGDSMNSVTKNVSNTYRATKWAIA